MRIRLSLFLGLLIGAWGAVSAQSTDEPSQQERIAALIGDLSHPYYEERERAKELLLAEEAAAVPALIGALTADDYRVREAASFLLGELGDERALGPLVASLIAERELVRRAQARALTRFGEPGRQALLEALQEHPEAEENVRFALGFFARRLVEERLRAKVTTRGGYGFYEGQFEDIVELGPSATPVLLDIFRDPYHRYQSEILGPFPASNLASKLRYLAGEALADMKDPQVLPELRAIYEGVGESDPFLDRDEVREAAAYAMFRIGEPGPYEQVLEERRRLHQSAPSNFPNKWRLANMLIRTRHLDEAESLYREIIGDQPANETAHFNMACIMSLAGRLDEAIMELRRAVEAGYDDWEWMSCDGDLSAAREHPAFASVLGEIKEPLDEEDDNEQELLDPRNGEQDDESKDEDVPDPRGDD